ncbi:MAG: hypothetical protein H0V70_00595 [Ktedonobacteraceae bacterium]|nr:hypothetical protein [Ktedonobacteraceae bacterium]
MNDPLSQFRREQPTTKVASHASKVTTEKKPYEAFVTASKPVPYMEILCVIQPSQSPQSRFLMAAVFSADVDEVFMVIYSYMTVEIKGQNLREVRRAIQNGRCEFIQEFHENEFVKPSKGEPIIESIKFITDEKLDDILSSYKGK